MKKYQYKAFTSRQADPAKIEARANELGQDGWKLVAVCVIPQFGLTAFFRREIRKTPKEAENLSGENDLIPGFIGA